MIYTLGCSFTKWYWPTWSDWLAIYTKKLVVNWAYPGLTNSAIYYKLLANTESITANDEIYIMWTGNNRSCQWYDNEWIEQHDCRGFFPDRELWFGQNKQEGFYKTHPDHMPSQTHLIIDNFNIIFNTQLLLDRVGCKYRMMFWQNPWLDTRETFKPSFNILWNKKQHITKSELELARSIMSIAPVANLLTQLDWSKFINAPDCIDQPEQYSGLWEHMLDNPELILLNHEVDQHPNTATHHDWLVEKVLKCQPQCRETAVSLAQTTQKIDIPDWSSMAVIDGWNSNLNKYDLNQITNQ